ncbi:MAG: hypothetical protein KY475_20185 [Planctomycetes bacterium]|nr:hypothetical protein [Planctomycetota bacterium]
MGFLLLILGATLCFSGMFAHLEELRLSRRVSLATRGRPDGLTATEVWLNTRQFRKWKKLRDIAASHPDETLRSMANRALRLELLFYGLFAAGMIAMLLGAVTKASAGS